MDGAQAATVNCKKCNTTHFFQQLFHLGYKCQNCQTPFENALNAYSTVEILQETVVNLQKQVEFLREQRRPEELAIMLDKMKSFYTDYGHRLVIIEDLFAGKSFRPIHDAMEFHVENFNKRIEKLEKNFEGFVEHMGGQKIDDEKTTDRLGERLEAVEEGLEDYKDYRTDIEDLQTDLMYAKEQIDKLEKENHSYKSKSHGHGVTSSGCVAGSGGSGVYRDHRQPHQCPVCIGAGYTTLRITSPRSLANIDGLTVDMNFRSREEQHLKSKCQPCEGSGVLWK